MTTPEPLAPLEQWTDERLIMRAEAIAASWHRVLDREQVYLLRGQILGLLREVYRETADHRSTISQLVNANNRLVDDARQLEQANAPAQVAAAGDKSPEDPNYIGSTTWKGWKVDLYQGEKDEDD